MQFLIFNMPELRVLELGYNRLKVLGGSSHPPMMSPKLESLNFDSNLLEDWISVMDYIRPYSRYVVISTSEDMPFACDTFGLG